MKGRCTSYKVSIGLSKKEVNIVRTIQASFLLYVLFHNNIIIIDNDVNPSLSESCNIRKFV